MPVNLYDELPLAVIFHVAAKPNSPSLDTTLPLTDKSPIIIKLPSMGAILLIDASGTVKCVLIDTSFKKVIPAPGVNSSIILNELSLVPLPIIFIIPFIDV